jgi:predicted RNA-binding protein YlqC (UPF0109 family)
MAASIDQQFIEYIVKSLVNNPDAVKIERRIDEKGVLLELTVDPEDLGRVIGKRGATAQSLRTLLRALGTKNDARYNLKIVDVGGPGARRGPSDDRTDDQRDDDQEESKPKEPASSDNDIEEVEEETRVEEVTAEEPSDVVSRTLKRTASIVNLFA